MAKPTRPLFQNTFSKRGKLTLHATGRAEELRRRAESDNDESSCDHKNARGALYLSPHCPRCGEAIRTLVK